MSVLVLVLGIAPACSSEERVETVYDPCSPLTIVVEDGVTAEELGGIEGAIALWNAVLPTQIAIGSGPKAPDALPIRFEPGEPFYRGIYWDATGDISIARDRLASGDYALAIAHEMGHAFGLLHVAKTERLSVMNVGNLAVPPTEQDATLVRARWDTCGSATSPVTPAAAAPAR